MKNVGCKFWRWILPAYLTAPNKSSAIKKERTLKKESLTAICEYAFGYRNIVTPSGDAQTVCHSGYASVDYLRGYTDCYAACYRSWAYTVKGSTPSSIAQMGLGKNFFVDWQWKVFYSYLGCPPNKRLINIISYGRRKLPQVRQWFCRWGLWYPLNG